MKIEISLTSHISKPIKYYVNKIYRKKISPKLGSIIYSDFGQEGIYIGNDEIVTLGSYNTLNETKYVKKISVDTFLKNNKFLNSVYISSNSNGAIENEKIVEAAIEYIGEKNNFGLVFKNTNSFIKKCLDYSKENFFDTENDLEESFKSELGLMKQKAKNKIGAIKWLLWDFELDEKNKKIDIFDDIYKEGVENNLISEENIEKYENLNIRKIIKEYEEIPLNNEIIIHLKKELSEMIDFFREIQDERLPNNIMKLIIKIIRVLEEIIFNYENNENTLNSLGGGFSYKELKETGEDFKKIANEMQKNKHIQEILRRLGKGKLEKSRDNKNKVAKINKNEIFGIDRSSDLSRLLPSELLNLEDESLKYLFYSKYLEKSLLTYEIKGNSIIEKNESEDGFSNKGTIVVCLDTSGSMNGSPIIKAKALVLAIVKILKKENRELHIIIFGAKNQYQEVTINSENQIIEVIKFLRKSYDGGTYFETPLKRAMEIIDFKKNYEKADILMVTDGACKISHVFRRKITEEKERMKFKIYTIICESDRVEKDFSDGVFVI